METYAVTGVPGAGVTATALNLVVALRGAGRHAAMLDARGDVAGLLDIEPPSTLEDVLAGQAGVRAATVEYSLDAAAIPEEALSAYREAIAGVGDSTAFRAGGEATPSVDAAGAHGEPPDADAVPVVAGGDPGRVRPEDAEGLTADLAMAYEFVVIDAGTRPHPLADEAVVVATPEDGSISAARAVVDRWSQADTPVGGAVLNRAGEDVRVADVADGLGLEVLAVVPADERTPAIEPVAFSARNAPAAAAYDRLAETIVERATRAPTDADETPRGHTRGGTDRPDATEAADGTEAGDPGDDGAGATDDEGGESDDRGDAAGGGGDDGGDDDDGGLLGGLVGRFG